MKNIVQKIESKIDIVTNHIDNDIKIKKAANKIYHEGPDNRIFVKEAIILVHTGLRPIPDYLRDCIQQIRLFDKGIPIYFVCSRKKKILDFCEDCTIVFEEDLFNSGEHLAFLRKVAKMDVSRFFQTTIERFFILYDTMLTLGVKSCIHLENDNLLYDNATELMRKLSKYYEKIATPRSRKEISYASIMYIPSKEALADFLDYINNGSQDVYFNDMALLPAHVDEGRGMTLPITFEEYVTNHGLRTISGETISNDERESDYFNYANELEGIFDCAPLGQYLDGCDYKYHPGKRAGYVNDEVYIDARIMPIHWQPFGEELHIPYVYDGNTKYRVFNLHIHSKRLNLYRSDIIERI